MTQCVSCKPGWAPISTSIAMGDHIKVSTIAGRRMSSSCPVRSRPLSSECTLIFSFRGLTIVAHNNYWNCSMTCSGLCEPLSNFLLGSGNRLIDEPRANLCVKHLGVGHSPVREAGRKSAVFPAVGGKVGKVGEDVPTRGPERPVARSGGA